MASICLKKISDIFPEISKEFKATHDKQVRANCYGHDICPLGECAGPKWWHGGRITRGSQCGSIQSGVSQSYRPGGHQRNRHEDWDHNIEQAIFASNEGQKEFETRSK